MKKKHWIVLLCLAAVILAAVIGLVLHARTQEAAASGVTSPVFTPAAAGDAAPASAAGSTPGTGSETDAGGEPSAEPDGPVSGTENAAGPADEDAPDADFYTESDILDVFIVEYGEDEEFSIH